MASTVFDANLGLKTTTDSLDALGISVAELQGLSPEQQFQLFANALAGVDDASRRAALAQDVFGRSGTHLLPLFTQGEQGMAALREQAQQLGVVMSGDAATAAADFADAQNELKSALSGVFLEVGAKIVPELTKFIRKVIEWKPQIVAFFIRIKEAATPFFEAFKDGRGSDLAPASTMVPIHLLEQAPSDCCYHCCRGRHCALPWDRRAWRSRPSSASSQHRRIHEQELGDDLGRSRQFLHRRGQQDHRRNQHRNGHIQQAPRRGGHGTREIRERSL